MTGAKLVWNTGKVIIRHRIPPFHQYHYRLLPSSFMFWAPTYVHHHLMDCHIRGLSCTPPTRPTCEGDYYFLYVYPPGWACCIVCQSRIIRLSLDWTLLNNNNCNINLAINLPLQTDEDVNYWGSYQRGDRQEKREWMAVGGWDDHHGAPSRCKIDFYILHTRLQLLHSSCQQCIMTRIIS